MMFAALLMATVLVAEPAAIVDFDSQIVPMLTHAGCNAGACHGAAAGRSGFHLSLFGSDPQADYAAIVSFAEGRRINHVDVAKSLVLAKPLGMLDHGGGEVLEEDSTSVAVLRRWIGQGATREHNGTSRICESILPKLLQQCQVNRWRFERSQGFRTVRKPT